MNSFLTEAENYVSFPVWFQDSLVMKNHISKLNRSIFISDNQNDEFLFRENRTYLFAENGQLRDFNVIYYYDNQLIGKVHFNYPGWKDYYGYNQPVRITDSLDAEAADQFPETPFIIHKKKSYRKKYLSYENPVAGNKLFYLINSHFQGPLSVDSILHPDVADQLVLGTPAFPWKKYRVINKVKELDVREYFYQQKSGAIVKIKTLDEPFEIRRTFNYNQQGTCNGFIDSTFSGRKYLTRSVGKFYFNPKTGLPIRLITSQQNQQGQTGQVTIEKYTYE